MIQTRQGKILKELFSWDGVQAFSVEIEGRQEKCIVYPALTGSVQPGDEVLLNTTAMALSLGSGGFHYVISRIHPKPLDMTPGGHIMKLRYTPLQMKVLSVEEEDSPYHQEMLDADSLDGIPVLVGTLHSMLAPLCLGLTARRLKAAYVMTDGAALPMAFSQTVNWLKKKDLLVGTVSTGHAFGGDLEAVNIYSGLLAARKVMGADVIIVCMGPGIVGTGTKWGFTGAEQGDILNAVDTLQGTPIAVPRISFADARIRHQGISHHTLTVLSRICKVPVLVPLPFLKEEQNGFILEQIRNAGLFGKHRFVMEEAEASLEAMASCELKMSTMGRGIDQDREFFLALGAAAIAAGLLAEGKKPHFLQMC